MYKECFYVFFIWIKCWFCQLQSRLVKQKEQHAVKIHFCIKALNIIAVFLIFQKGFNQPWVALWGGGGDGRLKPSGHRHLPQSQSNLLYWCSQFWLRTHCSWSKLQPHAVSLPTSKGNKRPCVLSVSHSKQDDGCAGGDSGVGWQVYWCSDDTTSACVAGDDAMLGAIGAECWPERFLFNLILFCSDAQRENRGILHQTNAARQKLWIQLMQGGSLHRWAGALPGRPPMVYCGFQPDYE